MIIKLTLDRIEGDFCYSVDDNEKEYKIDKSLLPNLNEGDIFKVDCTDNNYTFVEVLKEDTANKKAELQTRLNRLFKKGK